jgi:long-chain fatty acid transport protein
MIIFLKNMSWGMFMAKQRLFSFMCVAGMLGLSTQAVAASFQLWEQDGAGVGNYHAGRAALANDASTAFYNPAGIMLIKNQQFVASDVGIFTDIQYRGTASTNTYLGGAPQSISIQGGGFSQVPDFHYVAPISEKFGFGLSVVAPFGLKTDYGRTTALRYVATATTLNVVDVSPVLGFNVTPTFSVGIGLDAQRMSARFNQTAVLGTSVTDTTSTNKGFDTAYGYHMGALYQWKPSTRVGLSYNSQVVHHIRGTSKAVGPVANLFNNGQPIVSQYANASLTLPAFTTLSLYHQLNTKWALMGTVIYTQWSVFQNLRLKNLAGVTPQLLPSNNITANVIEDYRNTWNFAVGADYYATENLTLRTGVGYDQTPTKNQYRNVQIPDNNRYAIALGGHYQGTKTLGFDLGWTHLFVPNTHIAPPLQVTGAQVSATNGSTNSSVDILGAQVTWDIV